MKNVSHSQLPFFFPATKSVAVSIRRSSSATGSMCCCCCCCWSGHRHGKYCSTAPAVGPAVSV